MTEHGTTKPSQLASRFIVGVHERFVSNLFVLTLLLFPLSSVAQEAGAIRVRVLDQDWEVPVNEAQVALLEKNLRKPTAADGQVLFENVEAGRYTLSVGATGFERKLVKEVVVLAGQVQLVECKIQASYTDMDEFVIKDTDLAAAGSDIQLLEIRAQSPRLIDAIGADMLSKAGASTAAGALKLVTGATIQDGKYAVIRGLGDRYTSTSINAVRLPNADRDKRAVSLDQFPSALIESVQVSKTFLPDQQGDATGGINIMTKGVPDAPFLQAGYSTEYDSNATGNKHFKSYRGGGNDFGGRRDTTRSSFWDDDLGDYPRGGKYSMRLRSKDPPLNDGFKLSAGDYFDWDDWRFGGTVLGSYSQKYKYWEGVQHGLDADRSKVDKIKLDPAETERFENSVDEQLWSAGAVLGAKNENNSLKATTLYTHQSKDSVLLRFGQPRESTSSLDATDVRYVRWKNPATGKWENKEIKIPLRQGERHRSDQEFEIRERYVENANATVQLAGEHVFSSLNDSVLDWTVAYNMAESIEPDRRKIKGTYTTIGETWQDSVGGGEKPVWGDTQTASSTNMQSESASRRWQDTREDGVQWQANYKQPFSLREGWDGYLKTGYFMDRVVRTYRNRSYSGLQNVGTPVTSPDDFTALGSGLDKIDYNFNTDSIQYDGKQDIDAYYLMGKAPLPEWLEIIGGARAESTLLSTRVSRSPGGGDESQTLKIYEKIDDNYIDRAVAEQINNPAFDVSVLEQRRGMIGFSMREAGDGDAEIDQLDVLPAGTVAVRPIEELTVRFGYAQTIARPIFKEITPILYEDYDDNRVFLGNPKLEISRLDNYDLRVEWRPDPQGADLLAASLFYKKIKDPIQYSIRLEADNVASPDIIYPENYGDAEIKGVEFEARKHLGFISDYLKELSVGGNLTLQESEVEYMEDLREPLKEKGVKSSTRPMDGQSDELANVNIIFDNEYTGLSCGLFYNWRGETYVAGDTANLYSYVPAIIENPVATLDLLIGFKFNTGESPYAPQWKIGLEFKNLLDPVIETAYRTPKGDLPRTGYKMGRIYGVSLGCSW